jgi:hypothetical protein
MNRKEVGRKIANKQFYSSRSEEKERKEKQKESFEIHHDEEVN